MDIRFMIVGYRDDKGYGVKDLDDNMVEYFTKSQVLKMSKIVKIYGVENGDINLDWFRDYYSKCALCMSDDEIADKIGIFTNNEGKFEWRHNFSTFNFAEFIECFPTGNPAFITSIIPYLACGNSTMFHLSSKLFEIESYVDIQDGRELSLDIKNILWDGAYLYFNGRPYKPTVIKDLGMNNIKYSISRCKCVYAVNIPSNSSVTVDFKSNGTLYIGKDFNLTRFKVNLKYLPNVYLEDMSMKPYLCNVFDMDKKLLDNVLTVGKFNGFTENEDGEIDIK